MDNKYLFNRVNELKEKFRGYFVNKKKITALENYADVVPFHHKEYLTLIKRCMADRFMGEKEADFLSHIIDIYFSEQNYLDWTHKTKWLKGEIKRLKQEQEPKAAEHPLFDWEKKHSEKSAATIAFDLALVQEKKRFEGRV